MAKLEVIGFNLQSCAEAQAAGADRIELCANAAAGGTTPSPGTIIAARKILQIPLIVMVRPRSGDFLYSDQEKAAMLQDIIFCKNAGADGIALGCLHANGTVDVPWLKKFVEAAEHMSVTFHRAFDRAQDLRKSMDEIAEAGCACILTSGGYPTATEGFAVIAALIENAPAGLQIMPGSGVRAGNIRQFVEIGAEWIHSSARIVEPSNMDYNSPNMRENLQTESVHVQEIAMMKSLL